MNESVNNLSASHQIVGAKRSNTLRILTLSMMVGFFFSHIGGIEKLTGNTGVNFINTSEARLSPASTGMYAHPKLTELEIARLVRGASVHFDVESALALAVIEVESGFDQNAESPKGAMGLMQLMPNTAKELNVKDPFNPVLNVYGGIEYLEKMLKKFRGNKRMAIAAYNAGPAAVKRHKGIPPFAETQNYVKKVWKAYSKYKKGGHR